MRYLSLTPADRADMLRAIGASSIEEIYLGSVPSGLLLREPLPLPSHRGEMEVAATLEAFAAQNTTLCDAASFLGAGISRHYIPAAVDHLIQRSEFLTAYTPYQPEIAQGTLQYLYEFQTQVAMISSMDVANASLYDGGVATCEAALMARRVTRRNRVVVSGNLHPHYRDILLSCPGPEGVPPVVAPDRPGGDEDLAPLIDGDTACVIVQLPDFYGHLADFSRLAGQARQAGALFIMVSTEVLAFGAIRPPGQTGADIFAAEGGSLAGPPNFGGPLLGLFACRDSLVRHMPGRICGETRDLNGKRGYVLTLSTREQHIRRERATSNVCTNAGLVSLAFCIHLALLGDRGFRKLAELNHARAVQTAERLEKIPGIRLLNRHFFNEFTLELPQPADTVVNRLAEGKLLAGVPVSRLCPDRPELENLLLVSVTEMNSPGQIERLATGLGAVCS